MKSKGSKIISIIIVSLILAGIMPMMSENVAGEMDVIYSEATKDGDLWSVDYSDYDEAIWGIGNYISNHTTSDYAFLGQFKQSSTYVVQRVFSSFNTSSIPADQKIVSVKLNHRVSNIPSFSSPDFNVKVYNVTYGNLDSGDNVDWNSTGTYQGILCNATDVTYGDWVSMSLPPAIINKSGDTQFLYNSSREGIAPTVAERIVFYMGDSEYPPYLSVTTITDYGIILTYNYSAPGMTNETAGIYPVEIIDRGTDDLYLYEFMSFNETWLNMSVDSNFTYEGINPPCSVLDYGTGIYNITGTHDNSQHWIWFSLEKNMTNKLFISTYHHTKGDGLPWTLYDIYINQGSWYNNTTAERVFYPEYNVIHGETYVLTAMDGFGNMVTNMSFVSSGPEQFIHFPIPLYQFNIINVMAENLVDFRIWFNAGGTPYWDDVGPGLEHSLTVQNGTFMCAFTRISQDSSYVNTNLSTEWKNLTINGTYTITVGESDIGVIRTLASGISIEVDYISGNLTDDVVYSLDNPAMATEGSRGGGVPYLATGPQMMITTDVRISQSDNTDGPKTLWGGELEYTALTGTVTFIKDTITISCSNTSASLLVNDTTSSTNIINTSCHPGALYDLMNDYPSSKGHNLTVYSNSSAISIIREIEFRWTRGITWVDSRDEMKYTALISANNTLDLRMNNPEILVTFSSESTPDMDGVYVYDLDNRVYLNSTYSFSVLTSGISFGFPPGLNSAEKRSFRIDYFSANQTETETMYIEPNYEPEWYTYGDEKMRYVWGTYRNGDSSNRDGAVHFTLNFDEARDINPESIIVLDLTKDGVEIKDSWFMSEGSIIITEDYGIDLEPTESISIGILYKLDSEAALDVLTDPVFLGMSWPVLGGIFTFIMFVLGIALRASKKQEMKDTGKTFIGFGIFIGLIDLLFVTIVSFAAT